MNQQFMISTEFFSFFSDQFSPLFTQSLRFLNHLLQWHFKPSIQSCIMCYDNLQSIFKNIKKLIRNTIINVEHRYFDCLQNRTKIESGIQYLTLSSQTLNFISNIAYYFFESIFVPFDMCVLEVSGRRHTCLNQWLDIYKELI